MKKCLQADTRSTQICSKLHSKRGNRSINNEKKNNRWQNTIHKEYKKWKQCLLKSLLTTITEENNTSWIKSTNKYLQETNITLHDISSLSKDHLKEKTRQWDTQKWKEEVNSKHTLNTYQQWKSDLKESFYDNRPASVIFYKAKANCLPQNDRKRHTNENEQCGLCGAEKEDLEHFILWCPAYTDIRTYTTELQQPYTENTQNIIGHFLFDQQNIYKKINTVYNFWKIRQKNT